MSGGCSPAPGALMVRAGATAAGSCQLRSVGSGSRQPRRRRLGGVPENRFDWVPRGTWFPFRSPLTRVASSMASRPRHTVRETALTPALYPVTIFGLSYRPFGELLAAATTAILATLAAFIVHRHRPDRVAGLPPPPSPTAPVLTPPRGRPGTGSGSPAPCAAAVPLPQSPADVDAVAQGVFRRARSREFARAASEGES
jgi:hypothetical protein